MRRKALDLLRSYLFQRFIQVVSNGETSKICEIFSSVPQGGKLSPPLWDFDINDMHTVISAAAELFCYADDCGLWYELTESNREMIIDIVNLDLLKLKQWGIKNKTTFEPSKTFMIVMSNRAVPFDPTGINFDGEQVVQVETMKLVGFTLDCKLTWKPMVEAIAKKAQIRLGALRRLKRHLDSNNIQGSQSKSKSRKSLL